MKKSIKKLSTKAVENTSTIKGGIDQVLLTSKGKTTMRG